MANLQLFQSLRGKLPPVADAANHHGAPAYCLSPQHKLAQYAATGCLNATYYAQRAGAGLIISEGTQPSAVGQGYLGTPGIHDEEQVAGWAKVADAVHERNGRLFIQLMHVGRVAHPDNKHGLETVSASALAAPGMMVTRIEGHGLVVRQSPEAGGMKKPRRRPP